MGRALLRLYGRILDFMDRLVVVAVVIAMATMAIVVVGAIVCRYFFDSPLTWSEELSRFLLIFVCFVGAVPIITRGGFGQVESLISKLSPSKRRWMDVFISLFSMLFTGVSFGLSAYLVFVSEAVGNQITPAMHMPMRVIYSFMPLGFGVMFFRETEQMLLRIFPLTRIENREGTD